MEGERFCIYDNACFDLCPILKLNQEMLDFVNSSKATTMLIRQTFHTEKQKMQERKYLHFITWPIWDQKPEQSLP